MGDYADLTAARWQPQIQYGDSTYFRLDGSSLSATYDFPVDVGLTQSRNGMHTRVPLVEGGLSFGMIYGSPTLDVTVRMHECASHDLIMEFYQDLKTALDGRAVGASSWPKNHFRFYLYRDTGAGKSFYFDKCVCTSGPTLAGGFVEKREFQQASRNDWTTITFSVLVNDPTPVYNGSASADTTTVIETNALILGRLIVRNSSGTIVAQINPYNMDSTAGVLQVVGGIQTDLASIS